MLLSEFNRTPSDQAAALVQQCATVPTWAGQVAAGRPFIDVTDLVAHAHALSLAWTRDEICAALADHPRIGERREADDELAAMSAREQAGVLADAVTAARLHAGNTAYERRFERVFLIRAAGRNQQEILAELDRRLGNDDATEWDETAQQLREIALLRLQDLFECETESLRSA